MTWRQLFEIADAMNLKRHPANIFYVLAPLSPVIVYCYAYTLIGVYKHCGWFCAVVVLSTYPAHFRTVYVRFRTWNHKRKIAKALKHAKQAVDAQYTVNNEGEW